MQPAVADRPKLTIPSFLRAAYTDQRPIVVIKAGRRCFVGDTLVNTPDGHKRIADISIGDYVLTYNHGQGIGEYKEVQATHKYGRQNAKPIVQLEYDNKTIQTTYDHPFYTQDYVGQEGYFPAFVIAWRIMEADSRNRIKVFCERQGEDINHQLQMFWGSSYNDASTGRCGLLSNNGVEEQQVQHDKTTSRDCQSIYTKPSEQTSNQPQRLEQNKQRSKQLGMGHVQRERRALRIARQTVKKPWREVRNAYSKRTSGSDYTENALHAFKTRTQTNSRTVWSGSVYNLRDTVWQGMAISSVATGLQSAKVLTYRKTTYDLTVADNHNYCVTKDNVLGHNTGKTKNFVTWIIQELNTVKPDGQLKRGLWVDTKQSNIDKYIDRYFKPTLTRMNLWAECDWNQQKKILVLWNGNTLDFGSAERAELLEGFGYDAAVINEGGIVFKRPQLWDNTLYPMLKHAKVRIIGTPKGKNKFESLYRQYPHYTFSAFDSPFWTPDEIEAARKAMTEEAFRQEMLAEFIEGAGAVFRTIGQNIGGSLLESPVAGCRYALSADIAKHQDFTVIFIGDVETKQVVYHEFFNQIDWGIQKARITNAYHRFNCYAGIIDATGVGDAVFDDLRNEGLNLEGFKFTSTTKQQLVSNLSVALDNGTLTFPKIDRLIDELEMYAYEQRANGQFSYSAPEGFNDDEVMSLGLLNRIMNTPQIDRGDTII